MEHDTDERPFLSRVPNFNTENPKLAPLPYDDQRVESNGFAKLMEIIQARQDTLPWNTQQADTPRSIEDNPPQQNSIPGSNPENPRRETMVSDLDRMVSDLTRMVSDSDLSQKREVENQRMQRSKLLQEKLRAKTGNLGGMIPDKGTPLPTSGSLPASAPIPLKKKPKEKPKKKSPSSLPPTKTGPKDEKREPNPYAYLSKGDETLHHIVGYTHLEQQIKASPHLRQKALPEFEELTLGQLVSISSQSPLRPELRLILDYSPSLLGKDLIQDANRSTPILYQVISPAGTREFRTLPKGDPQLHTENKRLSDIDRFFYPDALEGTPRLPENAGTDQDNPTPYILKVSFVPASSEDLTPAALQLRPSEKNMVNFLEFKAEYLRCQAEEGETSKSPLVQQALLSFPLWHRGNLFIGPNTSKRVEVGADKDDLDIDFIDLAANVRDEEGQARLQQQLFLARQIRDQLKKVAGTTPDTQPTDAQPLPAIGQAADNASVNALLEAYFTLLASAPPQPTAHDPADYQLMEMENYRLRLATLKTDQPERKKTKIPPISEKTDAEPAAETSPEQELQEMLDRLTGSSRREELLFREELSPQSLFEKYKKTINITIKKKLGELNKREGRLSQDSLACREQSTKLKQDYQNAPEEAEVIRLRTQREAEKGPEEKAEEAPSGFDFDSFKPANSEIPQSRKEIESQLSEINIKIERITSELHIIQATQKELDAQQTMLPQVSLESFSENIQTAIEKMAAQLTPEEKVQIDKKSLDRMKTGVYNHLFTDLADSHKQKYIAKGGLERLKAHLKLKAATQPTPTMMSQITPEQEASPSSEKDILKSIQNEFQEICLKQTTPEMQEDTGQQPQKKKVQMPQKETAPRIEEEIQQEEIRVHDEALQVLDNKRALIRNYQKDDKLEKEISDLRTSIQQMSPEEEQISSYLSTCRECISKEEQYNGKKAQIANQIYDYQLLLETEIGFLKQQRREINRNLSQPSISNIRKSLCKIIFQRNEQLQKEIQTRQKEIDQIKTTLGLTNEALTSQILQTTTERELLDLIGHKQKWLRFQEQQLRRIQKKGPGKEAAKKQLSTDIQTTRTHLKETIEKLQALFTGPAQTEPAVAAPRAE